MKRDAHVSTECMWTCLCETGVRAVSMDAATDQTLRYRRSLLRCIVWEKILVLDRPSIGFTAGASFSWCSKNGENMFLLARTRSLWWDKVASAAKVL